MARNLTQPTKWQYARILPKDAGRASWNGRAVGQGGRLDLEEAWVLIEAVINIHERSSEIPRPLTIGGGRVGGSYTLSFEDGPLPARSLTMALDSILSDCRPGECRPPDCAAGESASKWTVWRKPPTSATLAATAKAASARRLETARAAAQAYFAAKDRPRLVERIWQDAAATAGEHRRLQKRDTHNGGPQ